MNILRTLIAAAALLPIVASAQVNARRADQNARIRQGVASGQLTHREARGLRTRESLIHAQARRDRFVHGGHLTPREHARLNRAQNRTSRAIYRDKHNARVRP